MQFVVQWVINAFRTTNTINHPDNSGLSILEYLTQDKAIIPSDKGHFSNKTYRMLRKCESIAFQMLFMIGKLKADESNQSQIVLLNK